MSDYPNTADTRIPINNIIIGDGVDTSRLEVDILVTKAICANIANSFDLETGHTVLENGTVNLGTPNDFGRIVYIRNKSSSSISIPDTSFLLLPSNHTVMLQWDGSWNTIFLCANAVISYNDP